MTLDEIRQGFSDLERDDKNMRHSLLKWVSQNFYEPKRKALMNECEKQGHGLIVAKPQQSVMGWYTAKQCMICGTHFEHILDDGTVIKIDNNDRD